jgi:nitrous oxide reductase accessory protein NosL
MDRIFRLSAFLLILLALGFNYAMAGSKSGIIPSVKEKCPVCGMFVAKYPDWTAVSKMKDGTTYYFDGPRDMFTHYLNIGRYAPGRQQSDIIELSVKEYYSLKAINAGNAFFVTGSDVYGPMGSELVPFSTEKDAASFMKDHKGKKILRFNEVSMQLLKSLK